MASHDVGTSLVMYLLSVLTRMESHKGELSHQVKRSTRVMRFLAKTHERSPGIISQENHMTWLTRNIPIPYRRTEDGGGEPILKEAYSCRECKSAICVQRFDDSLNSAIRITYRISLRSSSLREPRYPLLTVVLEVDPAAD
jgi:hypothetical protein